MKTILKNRINKKGEGTNPMGWLLGGLMFFLLVVLGFVIYDKSQSTISSADIFMEFNDYDGDSQKDALDSCPCGTDNVKQEINGKAYCLASFDMAQCICANNFANSALKEAIKSKYKNPQSLFIWNDAENKCLYMKDQGCKYYIYAENNRITDSVGNTACSPMWT